MSASGARPRVRSAALVCAAGLVLWPGSGATGQTIRPLSTELGADGRGRLELVNESDRALNAVIEARGFSVDENGEVRDEPMDGRVQLQLSAMSLRIPPRQTRFVFFEARADETPAWFLLLATFSGYPTRDFKGINVLLELPHYVYLLPSERLQPADVAVTGLERGSRPGRLVVTIANQSARFGRISALELAGGRRASAPGFALFPGARRRIELDWLDHAAPGALTIRTKDFSVERSLPPLVR